MLQCFGSIARLPLLRRFKPVLVTGRVAFEQGRTAPPVSRRQFEDARREGWITLHAPAPPRAIDAETEKEWALSRTDAELLVISERERHILFTDERILRGICRKRGVETYNLPEAIGILASLGELTPTETKEVILAMHEGRIRTFGPRDVDALGFPGLV